MQCKTSALGNTNRLPALVPGSADGLMMPVERVCQRFAVSRDNGLFGRFTDQKCNGMIHQCVSTPAVVADRDDGVINESGQTAGS